MGNMSEKKVSLFACPANPSHYAYNRGSQRSETMPLLLCWRMVIFQDRTRRDTKSMTVSEWMRWMGGWMMMMNEEGSVSVCRPPTHLVITLPGQPVARLLCSERISSPALRFNVEWMNWNFDKYSYFPLLLLLFILWESCSEFCSFSFIAEMLNICRFIFSTVSVMTFLLVYCIHFESTSSSSPIIINLLNLAHHNSWADKTVQSKVPRIYYSQFRWHVPYGFVEKYITEANQGRREDMWHVKWRLFWCTTFLSCDLNCTTIVQTWFEAGDDKLRWI